ncbi:unnamed protein product [Amoebophrya sp. A25]|nr:unnamed protein product [Amoebophrya sp. A25]|eukprot:GSA25T00002322001.1
MQNPAGPLGATLGSTLTPGAGVQQRVAGTAFNSVLDALASNGGAPAATAHLSTADEKKRLRRARRNRLKKSLPSTILEVEEEREPPTPKPTSKKESTPPGLLPVVSEGYAVNGDAHAGEGRGEEAATSEAKTATEKFEEKQSTTDDSTTKNKSVSVEEKIHDGTGAQDKDAAKAEAVSGGDVDASERDSKTSNHVRLSSEDVTDKDHNGPTSMNKSGKSPSAKAKVNENESSNSDSRNVVATSTDGSSATGEATSETAKSSPVKDQYKNDESSTANNTDEAKDAGDQCGVPGPPGDMLNASTTVHPAELLAPHLDVSLLDTSQASYTSHVLNAAAGQGYGLYPAMCYPGYEAITQLDWANNPEHSPLALLSGYNRENFAAAGYNPAAVDWSTMCYHYATGQASNGANAAGWEGMPAVPPGSEATKHEWTDEWNKWTGYVMPTAQHYSQKKYEQTEQPGAAGVDHHGAANSPLKTLESDASTRSGVTSDSLHHGQNGDSFEDRRTIDFLDVHQHQTPRHIWPATPTPRTHYDHRIYPGATVAVAPAALNNSAVLNSSAQMQQLQPHHSSGATSTRHSRSQAGTPASHQHSSLAAAQTTPAREQPPLSERFEEAQRMFDAEQFRQVLELIEALPRSERYENRQQMSAWQGLFVKSCRMIGTAWNGEIVESLYTWLQTRDSNLPSGDINACFFMLGRNREYELLVLLFQNLVDLTVTYALPADLAAKTGAANSTPNSSSTTGIEDSKTEAADSGGENGSGEKTVAPEAADEENASSTPAADGEEDAVEGLAPASAVSVSPEKLSTSDIAISLGTPEKEKPEKSDQAMPEPCTAKSLDVKGCGCAIQAATELSSVDILREVCGLIENLVVNAKERSISPPVNERLYYNIMGHWAKMGELAMAEQTVHRAREAGMVNSRFYHLLLSSYAGEKRWEKVEEVINMSRGALSLRQTFNLRVRMASEQGNLTAMRELLTEARQEELEIDEYAYYHLLKGFITKRELPPAEELFQTMETEAAKPLDKTKLQSGIGCPVYVLMFDLYFKTKNVEKALELFQKVRARAKETHAIYAQMVRNLTYASRWSDAISILKDMNDAGLADLEIHGLLVNKLFDANRKYEAAQLLLDKRPLCSKHTREKLPLAASSTILIRSAGHLQCLHFAFGVFQLYRDEKRCDSFMMNSLIDACIINQKSRKAISLYSQMRNEGLEPDCVTYNTIIRAYAMERDADSAMNILQEMRANSVAPNVVTYNTLVHTCVQLGQFSRAWQIVSEMHSIGVEPDCATYTSLISSIKQMSDGSPSHSHSGSSKWGAHDSSSKARWKNRNQWGQVQGGTKQEVLDRAFADVMKLHQSGNRIDAVLIRALLDACAHCGRPDLAERIFEMSRDILKFSQFEYGLLIKCYSQQRDLENALRVKQRIEMESLHLNAVIFGALIDLSLKISEDRKAEELFAEMEALNIPHSIISMSLKIKMYGRLNKPDKAMQALYQIQQLGLTPGILTFNSVIDSVARTGGYHHFQEILQMIKAYELAPNGCTYSIIAKGYAQGGQLEKALETFQMMESNGFAADPVTYNSLLDGCAKEGKVDVAERLLAEMEGKRVYPNAITWSILVKLYVPLDVSKAYGIIENLKQKHHHGDRNTPHPLRVVYSAFVHALANHGDLIRGKQLLMQMDTEGFRPDGYHYSSLAVAASQQNKLGLALEFVELAASKKHLRSCLLSTKTYQTLSKAIERKRDYGAKERLQQFLADGVFVSSNSGAGSTIGVGSTSGGYNFGTTAASGAGYNNNGAGGASNQSSSRGGGQQNYGKNGSSNGQQHYNGNGSSQQYGGCHGGQQYGQTLTESLRHGIRLLWYGISRCVPLWHAASRDDADCALLLDFRNHDYLEFIGEEI